jgi:hypothetical protein
MIPTPNGVRNRAVKWLRRPCCVDERAAGGFGGDALAQPADRAALTQAKLECYLLWNDECSSSFQCRGPRSIKIFLRWAAGS